MIFSSENWSLGKAFFVFLAATIPIGTCILAYRAQLAEQRAQERQRWQVEREAKMTVACRESGWRLDEIAQFDGSDPSKPIFFACGGRVYNVWRGEEFYGKGGPYQVFAGTDCTRLMAKNRLTPESAEVAAKSLNWLDREALAGWMDTFEAKYDYVGPLLGYDPVKYGLPATASYDGEHGMTYDVSRPQQIPQGANWKAAVSNAELAAALGSEL
jgi:membrane-associated progesterone receptor component